MDDQYLRAPAAATFLGVKRETLYAYVSRGWLESVPDPRSTRARLYSRSDLARLRARSDARAGEAPVAAAALRWGAPVLETSICRIDASGPTYRGLALTELVATRSFEEVAGLLWSAEFRPAVPWTSPASTAHSGAAPVDRLRHAALGAELADPTRDLRTDAAAQAQAESLLGAMASGLGAGEHVRFASRVAAAIGGEARTVDAIETALIVCAEHELNASTFAVRVAASTGANLYACVSAGLAAFVGPRHGGAANRVRRLVSEARSRGPRQAVLDRLNAGEALPGFGHPLYPDGDPRFALLWDAASRVDEASLADLAELLAVARELGLDHPNLDVGLVAVAEACGLVEGAEAALFAVGRTAGWIAHAREQAQQDFLLRPRARYVGRDPE